LPFRFESSMGWPLTQTPYNYCSIVRMIRVICAIRGWNPFQRPEKDIDLCCLA